MQENLRFLRFLCLVDGQAYGLEIRKRQVDMSIKKKYNFFLRM